MLITVSLSMFTDATYNNIQIVELCWNPVFMCVEYVNIYRFSTFVGGQNKMQFWFASQYRIIIEFNW